MILSFMSEGDIQLIWDEMCVADESYPFDCIVLSRMARTREFGAQARDQILHRLESGRFIRGDLWEYGKVADARVRTWFEREQQSGPPEIRKIIDKVLKAPVKAPDWVTLSSTEPERERTIYSTEVDLADLDREISGLGKKFQFKARKFGRSKDFLAYVTEGQWFVFLIETMAEPLTIWLRAEDADVVEIVLTKAGTVSRAIHQ
jgi:hypothetical protein